MEDLSTVEFVVKLTFKGEKVQGNHIQSIANNLANGITFEVERGIGIVPDDLEALTEKVEIFSGDNKIIDKEFY